MPEHLLDRYSFAEVRNAAAVIAASNSEPFEDITDVLSEFHFYDSDILTPGGNRGTIVRILVAVLSTGSYTP